MAATSATAKASIAKAAARNTAQKAAAKASGGSKTTLNARGDMNNNPVAGYISPTDSAISQGNIKGSSTGIPDMATSSLDKNLQNLANTNPEAADAAMDNLGYTGSPNSPERQGTPDLSKLVGAQYYEQKTGALNEAGNKYKAALSGLQASGPAPQDAGQGKMQAAGAITNTPTPPSPLGGIMETDKNFDNIFLELDKYMEPLQQKKTLLQEYKSMSKALDIDDLNEELIDAKKIIDGSEEDIRNEVTAAGGFATDSQVLAMANSRNKSLIKNYNVLLESRDNAMQQLNTMMDLTIEDRRAAESEFDRKMNFAFKVADFKQKAIDNSTSGYNKIIENVGYAGLYNMTANDPYGQSLIEKQLGLGTGGLAQLATFKPKLTEEEQLDLDLKRSSLETDKAQRANIYSQINERNNPDTGGVVTLNGKPQNTSQSSANSYANRLSEANTIISSLGSQFTGKFDYGGTLPNALQTGDRQTYEQAKKNFVTAVLRRESGASIAPSEFETASQQYFPQPGDKEEVLASKAVLRNTVINNFYNEANIQRPVNSGEVFEKDGMVFQQQDDGSAIRIK